MEERVTVEDQAVNNVAICWFCGATFHYDGNKYRDVDCPYCKVMNSIYDEEKKEPYQPLTTHEVWMEEHEKEKTMRPPVKKTTDFERVQTGDLISGKIYVEYDTERKFKGYMGGEDTVQLGIRFYFELEGYSFKHYTRWYKFSTSEKSNVYKNFVSRLVQNAYPNIDFDFDELNGMEVKTLWSDAEGSDFQNLDSVLPLHEKINIVAHTEEHTDAS